MKPQTENRNMKARPFTLSAVLLGVAAISTTASAESGSHAKAIDYRNSVMTVYKWNMGAMASVLKGERAYDQAQFKQYAQDLAAAAHLDLLSGFPEGSDEGADTDARMDIWMKWDDFAAKHADLKKASRELAEAAAGAGGPQAIGPKFSAVGKACKACHDNYKD
jgi:cytochrome c556